MRAATIGLLATLMLSACHKAPEDVPGMGNAAVANGFVPPEVKPASPLPGQTQVTPLTAYVGHYPTDAVDGVSFFDRSEVAGALNGAVIDAKVRRTIVMGGGPQTPIFAAPDGRIASWGCEAHNCGDHDWTVFVDPKTRKGEACYHDAATMGETSRWYKGAAPVTRPGDCPSGDGAQRDPSANASAAAN